MDTSIWARIVLVSPWFWCSSVTAVRVGVRILPYGQGCACLFVVLVLGCIAARVCVRIRPYGQGLSLSLRGFGARVFSAYGYGDVGKGLRLSPRVSGARVYGDMLYGYGDVGKGLLLRGPGAQRELRALVHGYGLWAWIALVSPWSWCSARVARIGVRIRPMGMDCAFCSWS